MKSHAQDSTTPLGKMAESKIYFIQKHRVMLSFDLANLYQVPTQVFTQAIKRNLTRFPSDFMFQLTPEEWISYSGKRRDYLDLCKTERDNFRFKKTNLEYFDRLLLEAFGYPSAIHFKVTHFPHLPPVVFVFFFQLRLVDADFV